jgi:hypothetical protein
VSGKLWDKYLILEVFGGHAGSYLLDLAPKQASQARRNEIKEGGAGGGKGILIQ